MDKWMIESSDTDGVAQRPLLITHPFTLSTLVVRLRRRRELLCKNAEQWLRSSGAKRKVEHRLYTAFYNSGEIIGRRWACVVYTYFLQLEVYQTAILNYNGLI